MQRFRLGGVAWFQTFIW